MTTKQEKDTFDDLFSCESHGCHNEPATAEKDWTLDEEGIKTSLRAFLTAKYKEQVKNGQRHGAKRVKRVEERMELIEKALDFRKRVKKSVFSTED